MSGFNETEFYRLRDTVERHERILCGPVTLEDKMKAYSNGLYDHEKVNRKEDISSLLKTGNERHKENTDNFGKAFRYIYIGFGIVITLEAIGLFHVGK